MAKDFIFLTFNYVVMPGTKLDPYEKGECSFAAMVQNMYKKSYA